MLPYSCVSIITKPRLNMLFSPTLPEKAILLHLGILSKPEQCKAMLSYTDAKHC